jgi:hypothetical protein
VQISLVKEGLLARGQLSTWSARTYARIRDAVRGGMQSGGARIAAEARADVQSKLKGKRISQSIRHKVWDRNKTRMPGLQISSKIPWLGVHERGRTITGRMLIPFGDGARMKRAAWRKFIDAAVQDGRVFFRKVKSSNIMFVRPAGKSAGLTRFRTGYRKHLRASGQPARIKRDRPIPIAVSVTRVTIKKRLRLEQIVRRGLPLVIRGMRI